LKHGFCFIFPSLYEGFGLPILEAMNTGIPIITSNVGSMPEIVLDGAVLIDDPLSVDSIVEAFEKIAQLPTLRKDLIRRGREISFSFTWSRCAEETLDYYNKIIQKGQ
jgi:glycosyltransferase involved in cell wall biosynthesis